MANAVQRNFKQRLGRGEINLETDTINVVGIDDAYTFSPNHSTLADIPSGTRVATATILNRQLILQADEEGVVQTYLLGDDAVFQNVPAEADPITRWWVYKQGQTEGASPLICYLDRDAAGNPYNVQPNGQNITLAWPEKKILRL